MLIRVPIIWGVSST